MSRAAATMPLLLAALALGAFSASAAVQEMDNAANEAVRMDSLETLSDDELEALADEYEAVEQARTEANLRYRDAHRAYFVRVVEAAVKSGELEHEVAALLLAGNFLMREHDFAPGLLDDLMARTMAGAALRPDLLAVLDVACGLLVEAWMPEDPGATRTPPQACADSDIRLRLTAIEPANAHHWIRLMDSAFRSGDRETARAHLLATGRSTIWRPPFRTALRLLRAMLTRWPPDQDFVDAANAASESVAQAGTLTASDAAHFEAWRDPDALSAQTTLALGLMLPFGSYQPALELCREAVATTDRAAVAACRRLARMMIDASDTLLDAMVGYGMLIETGSPSEAARAEVEREALRTDLLQAYTSALAEHDIAQDFVTDLAHWIEHGEIEMMRRGLARVEAELTRRASMEIDLENE